MSKPRVLIEGHDFSFTTEGCVILHGVLPNNSPDATIAPVGATPEHRSLASTVHVHVHNDADLDAVSDHLMRGMTFAPDRGI